MENAAKLFGNSKDILNNVLQRELPDLTVDHMASILKWRTCLKTACRNILPSSDHEVYFFSLYFFYIAQKVFCVPYYGKFTWKICMVVK